MSDVNYYQTLIAVADDCPVTTATVPQPRGGKPTVATLQHAMLDGRPFELTSEDVIFDSWFVRQPFAEGATPEQRADHRAAFFAKDQACLRSSPLPKQYGWGFLFDGDGRVALLAVDSPEYARLVEGDDPAIKVTKAMRSRRA